MALHRSQKLNLLRLAVLLTVALAGIKFSFQDRQVQHKEVSWGSRFWGSAEGPKEPARTLDRPRKQPDLKQGSGSSGQEKKKRLALSDFSSKQMRLVHLDLKGAPPRISYLEQIFPLFSEMGADGVLIEYEDMFPFQGELEILRSPYAYSEEDIVKIQELARLNKLEVIPLVQTFGHVEFILKHDKYRHLREVETYPNTFNPHVPETLTLLKTLLTQVLSKHPLSSLVHIGADEKKFFTPSRGSSGYAPLHFSGPLSPAAGKKPSDSPVLGVRLLVDAGDSALCRSAQHCIYSQVYLLGKGMDSKNWMNHHKGDTDKIYLNHIRNVVNFVVGQPWGLQVLLWDDVLRKIPLEAIRDSGIAKHASPVLWFYEPDFDTKMIEMYINNYSTCGFSSVWFASAFKGTTGPAQVWPPLDTHLRNHLQWLKVITSMKKMPSIHFQGIVLTGWQRYDHYSTLCELLPVGIPSLAVCLQTLEHGGFTEAAHKNVRSLLGFQKINMNDGTCEGHGEFPGSDIYHLVEQVKQHLKDTVSKALDQESALKGWFSPYHRKHKFGNPLHLENSLTNVFEILTYWKSSIEDLRSQMERIYFPDTVDEWMEENVNPHMDRLHKFIRDFKGILLLKAQPKKL